MAISGLLVLHPFEFFAARDDSSVTLAPEGRQIVAQCVSTGNGFFRPVPGLANLLYGPRARALGYSLSPSGLRDRFFCGAANPGCPRRLERAAVLRRKWARGCIAGKFLAARRSQHRRHPPAVLRVLRRPRDGADEGH